MVYHFIVKFYGGLCRRLVETSFMGCGDDSRWIFSFAFARCQGVVLAPEKSVTVPAIRILVTVNGSMR